MGSISSPIYTLNNQGCFSCFIAHVKTPPVEKEAHLSNYLWGGYVASPASADPFRFKASCTSKTLQCWTWSVYSFPTNPASPNIRGWGFGGVLHHFLINVIVFGFMLQPFSEVEQSEPYNFMYQTPICPNLKKMNKPDALIRDSRSKNAILGSFATLRCGWQKRFHPKILPIYWWKMVIYQQGGPRIQL